MLAPGLLAFVGRRRRAPGSSTSQRQRRAGERRFAASFPAALPAHPRQVAHRRALRRDRGRHGRRARRHLHRWPTSGSSTASSPGSRPASSSRSGTRAPRVPDRPRPGLLGVDGRRPRGARLVLRRARTPTIVGRRQGLKRRGRSRSPPRPASATATAGTVVDPGTAPRGRAELARLGGARRHGDAEPRASRKDVRARGGERIQRPRRDRGDPARAARRRRSVPSVPRGPAAPRGPIAGRPRDEPARRALPTTGRRPRRGRRRRADPARGEQGPRAASALGVVAGVPRAGSCRRLWPPAPAPRPRSAPPAEWPHLLNVLVFLPIVGAVAVLFLPRQLLGSSAASRSLVMARDLRRLAAACSRVADDRGLALPVHHGVDPGDRHPLPRRGRRHRLWLVLLTTFITPIAAYASFGSIKTRIKELVLRAPPARGRDDRRLRLARPLPLLRLLGAGPRPDVRDDRRLGRRRPHHARGQVLPLHDVGLDADARARSSTSRTRTQAQRRRAELRLLRAPARDARRGTCSSAASGRRSRSPSSSRCRCGRCTPGCPTRTPGADGGLGHPGRRDAEARHLRLPALLDGPLPRGRRRSFAANLAGVAILGGIIYGALVRLEAGRREAPRRVLVGRAPRLRHARPLRASTPVGHRRAPSCRWSTTASRPARSSSWSASSTTAATPGMVDEFGGLAKVMPVYAALFVIVTLASIGVPGTNGFIGEFMVITGTLRLRARSASSAASRPWAPRPASSSAPSTCCRSCRRCSSARSPTRRTSTCPTSTARVARARAARRDDLRHRPLPEHLPRPDEGRGRSSPTASSRPSPTRPSLFGDERGAKLLPAELFSPAFLKGAPQATPTRRRGPQPRRPTAMTTERPDEARTCIGLSPLLIVVLGGVAPDARRGLLPPAGGGRRPPQRAPRRTRARHRHHALRRRARRASASGSSAPRSSRASQSLAP